MLPYLYVYVKDLSMLVPYKRSVVVCIARMCLTKDVVWKERWSQDKSNHYY